MTWNQSVKLAAFITGKFIDNIDRETRRNVKYKVYILVRVCPGDVSDRQAESTIDSEGFKGGTRGAPIMPRDAVSRTANVERTAHGR